MAATVSSGPWNGNASRYSDSEWEKACILDKGPDFKTAKQRYGLPIREPDGTLNRRGMGSAAAALSGARTPIKAGTSEKAAARNRLQHAYQEAGLTLKSDIEVPIWKEDESRLVYGVVLQPGVEDSQGDILSAPEIEQAAHNFMVQSRKSDVQHDERQADVSPVESYVAPHDMVVAGKPVLKGAWVMASHVGDPDVWDRVKKGDLTGYSIGGTGIRKAEGEALGKAQELTNLDVEWVSLVDRAAVRDPVRQNEPMRFLVWKRDGGNPTQPNSQGGDMTPEELNKALEKADLTDEVREALEKSEADAADALKKAEDEVKALKAAAEAEPKFGTPEWEAKYGKKKKAESGESDDEGDGDDDDKPVNKSELDPKVRKALEKAEKDAAEKSERLAKAEKLIKEERELRLTKEAIAKAEAYKGLPVKAIEFGPVLKEAEEKLSKEGYEALEKALGAADEAIVTGELFKEQGRPGEAKQSTAYDEVARKAEEIRKADPKISDADAFDIALKNDRPLQERYLAEVR